MRILIVEDEEALARIVKDGLKSKGYAVDHLSDGEKAVRRIRTTHNEYDLIILDLGLPNKGGLDICKEIRKLNIDTPVLILTANGNLESKVSLFDAGADDYLVKPFEFDELFSRIRAITRRPKKTLSTELLVSDIVLNPATQKVLRAGREIKLTLKEFRILEYFMRNPGRVLSREDLVSNIYDFDYDSFSNVLDVFINKLRNKIDKGRVNKLIETVHGVGYRLNAHV
ncbi:MAG: response regulator transcription factor [Candidatus Staskawiczbacteria bacterium]|nr:response regulator transcription factor [Candidatus Staskawiczbacteria bacterium]